MIRQTKVICGVLTVSAVLGTCVMGQAAENIIDSVSADQMLADSSNGLQQPENKDAADNANNVHEKDKKKKKKDKTAEAKQPPAPVTIEGDQLSFNDKTGNVYAKGNVKIQQNLATVLADDIYGNTKRTEVQIDGKANITQPGMNLDGYATFYNYQAHTGNMANAKGIVDYEKHVQGERIEFLPEEYIIYNGTVTKCPAKNPDYNLRAKKIEIWPDDKLVAYDVQFLIKGKVIYSTARYETKIGANRGEDSAFPRIGYNSDDGLYIRQSFQTPLSNSIIAEADIGYYSKHNFQNEYQIMKYNPNYTLALRAGDYQDNDNNWIKKEPELQFKTVDKRLGDSSWKYSFNAIYGKWVQGEKSSWHQDYTLYFRHDPIFLNKSLKLNLGTGYEIVKESYDNSQINTMRYDVSFSQQINSKWSAYTGYHYTKNSSQNSLFDYNDSTIGENLASGISYKFDSKNSLSISQSYDLANKRTADMYYTWHHNLHCWDMDITYHKDYDGHNDSTNVKFKVAHW